jgi:hypothetical protein
LKVGFRQPLEIVRARNKKLEIAEDFKYETPFNFIYGEEW